MISVSADWEKDLEFFIPEFFPVIKKYDNVYVLADTSYRLIIGNRGTALNALKMISRIQELYRSLISNEVYIKGHVKVSVAVYNINDSANIQL